MKRILILLLTGTLGLTLSACTSGHINTVSPPQTSKQKLVQLTLRPKYQLADGRVTTRQLKIVITKSKLLRVGQPGNEHGTRPVIAFWFRVTNRTKRVVNADSAWNDVFKATQRQGKAAGTSLKMAAVPDDQLASRQTDAIRQNQTVTSAVAYELNNVHQSVVLNAFLSPAGASIGRQVYHLNSNLHPSK
ncbi:DUF5067 domain-containing protein [Lactiplantibacillus carotarum]|uniref:DUF5067 domain-containing protein n=1 Tax=Lactiplantibacillus carotarum TaxID=2993456 RepID=UPI00298EE854|nr:DUF5067 domain-containing protein [Lactiplantibacillus carotarum]